MFFMGSIRGVLGYPFHGNLTTDKLPLSRFKDLDHVSALFAHVDLILLGHVPPPSQEPETIKQTTERALGSVSQDYAISQRGSAMQMLDHSGQCGIDQCPIKDLCFAPCPAGLFSGHDHKAPFDFRDQKERI